MIRGEIWTVAGGVYASKPRPAVIVQDDLFDSTLSVVVAPMTRQLIDVPPCCGFVSRVTATRSRASRGQ